MKIIFISGPYSALTRAGRERNIRAAEQWLIQFTGQGLVAFCPHTHYAHFEEKADNSYEWFLGADLEFLARCDAIFLMPNWINSAGAKAEFQFAVAHNIRVFRDFEMCVEWAKR